MEISVNELVEIINSAYEKGKNDSILRTGYSHITDLKGTPFRNTPPIKSSSTSNGITYTTTNIEGIPAGTTYQTSSFSHE